MQDEMRHAYTAINIDNIQTHRERIKPQVDHDGRSLITLRWRSESARVDVARDCPAIKDVIIENYAIVNGENVELITYV